MTYRPSRREFTAGLASLAAAELLFSSGLAARQDRPHRIDFHCHFQPPAWLAFLKAQGQTLASTWSVSKHLEDMDEGGVQTSLLSLASPGLWHGNDLAAIRTVTRQVNEYAATLGADHPGRFGMFAAMPLMDIEGSLREVEYAYDTLHLDGVGVRTPYDYVLTGDPVFAPLYEELNRRRAVVFIHPQDSPCCQGLVPGVNTGSAIEYGTMTTRAIMSLLVSGTAARYPEIRWVFAHAGGTMPFLTARIVGRKLPVGPDGLVSLDPTDTSRRNGAERLALIRRFCYETAQQTNAIALGALRRLVPASQIVFGTDYPASDSGGRAKPHLDHAAGLTGSGVFTTDELRAIESENALRMFPRYRT